MKSKINISEFCGDSLTSVRGLFQSRASKLFLTLIFGLFLLSGMNRPGYMSYQMALQMLEPVPAKHLESLVTDVYPTAYLTQGEITTQGDGAPVVAIFDAASVNALYGNDPVLSQVELVKITANAESDLPASLELIKLEELTNLKYVLVEFAYDACGGGEDNCLNSILWEIIAGNSTKITVMYSHTIAE
jgi:hypothetical protein